MMEEKPQDAQGAPEQGKQVNKDMLGGVMQTAETEMQVAQMLAEGGQAEAAELLGQAVKMKIEALKKLGVPIEGAEQEETPNKMSDPNVAGVPGARPV